MMVKSGSEAGAESNSTYGLRANEVHSCVTFNERAEKYCFAKAKTVAAKFGAGVFLGTVWEMDWWKSRERLTRVVAAPADKTGVQINARLRARRT